MTKIECKKLQLGILLLLIFSFCLSTVKGQRSLQNEYWARNTFFIELGGKAWAYSINFERRIIYDEFFKVGVQAGFGVNMIENPPEWMYGGNLLIPFSVNGMIGKDAHHAEAGIGMTVQGTSSFNFGKFNYPTLGEKAKLISTFHLGYRYQEPLGGIFFRVGYTPMYRYINVEPPDGKEFRHWLGISLGYSMKNYNIK